MLVFNIGFLLNKPQGTKEKHEIDEMLTFENADDPKLYDKVICHAQFLKLPHEINVQLMDLHTVFECVCSRCLSQFHWPVDIAQISREFIIDLPQRDLQIGEDVFYVNKNTNQIDLTDMIREELLLHFPAVPLCSESCKGLCDKCGINLNEKACSCVHTDESRISLFKIPNH